MEKKTNESVKFEDSKYKLSLSKISDLKIKDVTVYVSHEFGDPCLKLLNIYFEDGTYVDCEGEHDFPYITSNPQTKNWYTDEILNEINKES